MNENINPPPPPEPFQQWNWGQPDNWDVQPPPNIPPPQPPPVPPPPPPPTPDIPPGAIVFPPDVIIGHPPQPEIPPQPFAPLPQPEIPQVPNTPLPQFSPPQPFVPPPQPEIPQVPYIPPMPYTPQPPQSNPPQPLPQSPQPNPPPQPHPSFPPQQFNPQPHPLPLPIPQSPQFNPPPPYTPQPDSPAYPRSGPGWHEESGAIVFTPAHAPGHQQPHSPSTHAGSGWSSLPAGTGGTARPSNTPQHNVPSAHASSGWSALPAGTGEDAGHPSNAPRPDLSFPLEETQLNQRRKAVQEDAFPNLAKGPQPFGPPPVITHPGKELQAAAEADLERRRIEALEREVGRRQAEDRQKLLQTRPPIPVQMHAGVGEVAIPIAGMVDYLSALIPYLGQAVLVLETLTGRGLFGFGEELSVLERTINAISLVDPILREGAQGADTIVQIARKTNTSPERVLKILKGLNSLKGDEKSLREALELTRRGQPLNSQDEAALTKAARVLGEIGKGEGTGEVVSPGHASDTPNADKLPPPKPPVIPPSGSGPISRPPQQRKSVVYPFSSDLPEGAIPNLPPDPHAVASGAPVFYVDSKGRTVGVQSWLYRRIGSREPSKVQPALSRPYRELGEKMDAAHLQADSLGGPDERVNMVPLPEGINRRDLRTIERPLEEHLKNPNAEPLFMQAYVEYQGRGDIPSELRYRIFSLRNGVLEPVLERTFKGVTMH